MLKTEYTRKINKSSLIIMPEKDFEAEKDSIEMFQYNQIPYFLKMEAQKKNITLQFCYDITGRRSLAQLLEYKSLDHLMIQKILSSFDQACIQAEDFMMTENDILLNPEFVFADHNAEQMNYCYLPGNQVDICGQFKEFMEYLLKNLDHKDEQAVQYAYDIYQRVVEERTALHNVLKDEMQIENEHKNVIFEQIPAKQYVREDGNYQFAPSYDQPVRKEASFYDQPVRKEPSFYDQSVRKEASFYDQSVKNEQASSDESVKSVQTVLFDQPANSIQTVYDQTVEKEWLSYEQMQHSQISAENNVMKSITPYSKENIQTHAKQQKNKKQKKRKQSKCTDDMKISDQKQEDVQLQKDDQVLKIRQKETLRKQAAEKLKNMLRKKIYTDDSRYAEEDTVFEADAEDEMIHSNPTVCLMPETEEIQNRFIYQGADRSRDFHCMPGKMILGSDVKESDIYIPLPLVSRVHARVSIDSQGTFLEDMNSTNGTHVNGELLQYREKRMLQKGDIISLAGENYSFH